MGPSAMSESSLDDVNWISATLCGLFLPLCFLSYGLRCLITHLAYLPARNHGWFQLDGRDAAVWGVSCLCMAVVFHMRFIWSEVFGRWIVAQLGQVLGICAWIICIGYLAIAVCYRSFAG
jgi:hypothetical protein